MTTTRRTALAMLGLGSATVVGAETFMSPPDKPGKAQSVVGGYDKERFARAFELLAAEIRRNAVDSCSLELKAVLEPDNIADVHELKFVFRHKPEV